MRSRTARPSWSATPRSVAPWWTGYAARCYPEGSPNESGCNRLRHCRIAVRLDYRLGAGHPERRPARRAVAAPVAQTAPAAAGAPAAQQPPPLDQARVQALQTVAEKDPKNVESRVQLGNLFFDAEQYPQAIAWYEQAIALNPGRHQRLDRPGRRLLLHQPAGSGADAVRQVARHRSQAHQDPAERRHRSRVRQERPGRRRQGVGSRWWPSRRTRPKDKPPRRGSRA